MRVLAWAAVAFATVYADEDDVVALTESTWEGHMKTYAKGTLVEFFAPWCGHCKALKPEYDRAAEMMKEDSALSAYKLATVDATVETSLGQKFAVQGYPTLKWFVDGVDTEYDGPREAKGIVAWIKSNTGPVVTEVDLLPQEENLPVVGLYGPELVEAFEGTAKKFRKAAQWYWIKGDTVKVEIKHVGEDVIVEEVVPADAEAMGKWFEKNQFPKFGAIDGESFGKYTSREGYGLIWGLFKMEASNVKEKAAEWAPMMNKVYEAVGDKYSVTYTNTAEFGSVMESMFGVSSFPKIVVQKKAGDKKYWIYELDNESAFESESALTKEGDALIDFVNKVSSGEIPANLKSEAAPAEPQEDPVKVIVGSTMQEKVFTADKDVLLEVYAPWCGHCKKLEPEYVKVGKKVEKEGFGDRIVIAKMDGTLNDSAVDSISWSGFPTMVYVKKGSEEVQTFDGDRTAKGIWKWIKKNSSFVDEIEATISAKKEKAATESEKKEEL